MTESKVPDRRSAEAKVWHRLYDTAEWKRLRQYQLAMEPLCRFCLITGRGDRGDDRRPHQSSQGSGEFFFDPSNLQSLCKHHHDSAKKMIDHGKMVVTYGLDGYPIEMG
ncbi:HNH endonuclease [Rhizobium sp. 007]|uniref:HNH endonuclease n=1 Tax=Rhizobium sp. 007 TaxID=2785056 RepID=UPI001FEFA7D7|nr:HNH endonuclease [Rhizobium sp. 007]